jgi:hypothetical protein
MRDGAKAGLFGLGLAGGCLIWYLCALAFNALLILLVWNGLDLHSVFGIDHGLTFTQGMGVAVLLALVGI